MHIHTNIEEHKTIFKDDGIILGGTVILLTYLIGHIIAFAGYYILEYPSVCAEEIEFEFLE